MKVVAILPAYKAAKTLPKFIADFPFKYFADVILVDDHSPDNTFLIAKKFRKLKVFETPRNLGYGGNLKFCLSKALELGAETIIEIHPDGEYGFDGILPAIIEVECGAKMVLGNRFDPRVPEKLLKN